MDMQKHTDLPITINEAINILAYNDFFYHPGPKLKNELVNPHPKDKETVMSLANSQYPWTEKQGKLALILLKRYLTRFQKHGLDIKDLLENPKYEHPFRVIDWEKSIEKFIDEDNEPKIEIKFPYNKKIINLIRCLKNNKGMPERYMVYNPEDKHWTCNQTDVTTYYLTLIAIRYNFKFVDKSLFDDYLEVKKEKLSYKDPSVSLENNQLKFKNVSEPFLEYWKENILHKPLLQQVDSLKEFLFSTDKIKVEAETPVANKIAHSSKRKIWISKDKYSREQVIQGINEINAWPIIFPVSGEILSSTEDTHELWNWIQAFKKIGINEWGQLAFGFDIKQPIRVSEIDEMEQEKDFLVPRISDDVFEIMFELHQMSQQFKYIDEHTKVLFVKNKIPRSYLKSKIRAKLGLWTGNPIGGQVIYNTLENLPRTLNYSSPRRNTLDFETLF